MDISLIITTYNWKEALGVSLASVLAQTLPPCEIIVADDGSRPDTGELVRGSIGYYIGLDKTAIPVEIRISDKLV